jgi:hypothetical protein
VTGVWDADPSLLMKNQRWSWRNGNRRLKVNKLSSGGDDRWINLFGAGGDNCLKRIMAKN